MIVMVCISVVFLVGALQGWLGLVGTIVMIFGILCCVGLLSPNTSALALAPFEKNAGVASSLLGASQMAIGSAVSVGISLFKAKSAVPMASVIIVSSAMALCLLLIGRRFIKTKVEAKQGGGVTAH